jgi:biopolymer transport protein ExbD
MKRSARARRMARSHKRYKQQAKLSLVSLMDIFTILVFFLMVNSGDVEVLEADKNISLPESVSMQKPDIALTIKVSPEDIVVQGRPMGSVEEVLSQPGNMIVPLKVELDYQAARAPAMTEREKKVGRQVVIMGDRDMSYRLLKRIMTTCAASDYRDITLAVNTAVPGVEEPQLAGGG